MEEQYLSLAEIKSLLEAEKAARAELNQERTLQLRNVAMDALVALIRDIRSARDGGAADERLTTARGRTVPRD